MNCYANRMIKPGRRWKTGGSFFQPKLIYNQPGDEYEQEADAVAERIAQGDRSIVSQPFFSPSFTQKKMAGNTMQLLPGGQPLSRPEQSFFGNHMGHDFSDVILHTDTSANESAESIDAKAYTYGNHIVFGKNQYQPHTTEGGRLMAHELTHVVQQKGMANTIQRDEQKPSPPDRYEELKDDKKAKEIFEKLNPGVLGRYCTQNCPAVAEALEEYLKTGVFPETHCNPLGEGSYGYDVVDTEFSDEIADWNKFWPKASSNLKKHGDFLVIEAHRTAKQAKENNLTEWHYFLVLNIKGKNFVIDAFTKEVNGNLDEYTTRLIANSYRYVKGDFKIKKVRVSK